MFDTLFDIWKDEKINYADLAPKLLKTGGEQQMVPFLGAGVSVSDRADEDAKPQPNFPTPATVDDIARQLKIEGNARLYLEYAIRTAVTMEAWEKANGPLPASEKFRKKLEDNSYPPFAWELAELFSQASAYCSLKEKAVKAIESKDLLPKEQRDKARDRLLPMVRLAAMTTGLGNSTDPLTSISSYYESRSGDARGDLWKHLYHVIAHKETPTAVHRLLAKAAALQLSTPGADDYLIMTTNYDCLMEKALDELNVPYAALWRNRKDGLIYSKFANIAADELKRLESRHQRLDPGNFILQKNRTLAVVYKMHGSLHKDLQQEDDSLVVSDADYVDFISQLDKIVPSHVGSLLGAKQLLFLGYSFSDWNVRSIYERIVKRRGDPKQDYAVTRSLSEFEEVYFKTRKLIVIMSDLATFAKGIREQVEQVAI